MTPVLIFVGTLLASGAVSVTVSLWFWHRRWTAMFGRRRATEMMGENFPVLRPAFDAVWPNKSSAINPDRYQAAYVSDDRKTEIYNLDGVPWHEAPIPPRRHECWAQTKGWTDYFTVTHRCACGAIRTSSHQRWWDRNERRPSVVDP